MRITRWGEYGILCCLYLAQRFPEAGAVGAAEIASTQNIPIKYAQQILHRLRRGGVIKSVRGPHGGFLLSREPMNINLKDVLYAAEGDTFEIICENDPVIHPNCACSEQCALHLVWTDLKSAVNQVLEGRTLATMIDQARTTGSLVQVSAGTNGAGQSQPG